MVKLKMCNKYSYMKFFLKKMGFWHIYCCNKLQQFITWLNFKMINHLTVKKGVGTEH